MVLDLGLPDIDGLRVIRCVRGSGAMLPIIVLSSRNNETAKVTALDLGADDYVTKPFNMDELLARIRAAQRHRLQLEGEKPVFRTGELSVDPGFDFRKLGERIDDRLDVLAARARHPRDDHRGARSGRQLGHVL